MVVQDTYCGIGPRYPIAGEGRRFEQPGYQWFWSERRGIQSRAKGWCWMVLHCRSWLEVQWDTARLTHVARVLETPR